MQYRVPTVIVQKLDPKAKIPCKPKSFDDAGWDVYPIKPLIIPPNGGDALIPTGLKVKIPTGYCIQVNPRSGKAVKSKLVVGARVIDAPYRGELMIHIFNHGKEPYEVSPHDPIAQLLVLQCASLLVEGEINDTTTRGEDGFGSTDAKLKYDSIHGTVVSINIDDNTPQSQYIDMSRSYAMSPTTGIDIDLLLAKLRFHIGDGVPVDRLTDVERQHLYELVEISHTLPSGTYIKK